MVYRRLICTGSVHGSDTGSVPLPSPGSVPRSIAGMGGWMSPVSDRPEYERQGRWHQDQSTAGILLRGGTFHQRGSCAIARILLITLSSSGAERYQDSNSWERPSNIPQRKIGCPPPLSSKGNIWGMAAFFSSLSCPAVRCNEAGTKRLSNPGIKYANSVFTETQKCQENTKCELSRSVKVIFSGLIFDQKLLP